MQTRKYYTPTFKAQVVQELLREEKTVGQLASEHGIHPNQLSTWKRMALEGLPTLFAGATGRRRSRRTTSSRWRICTRRSGG